jgi:hypothetical protein
MGANGSPQGRQVPRKRATQTPQSQAGEKAVSALRREDSPLSPEWHAKHGRVAVMVGRTTGAARELRLSSDWSARLGDGFCALIARLRSMAEPVSTSAEFEDDKPAGSWIESISGVVGLPTATLVDLLEGKLAGWEVAHDGLIRLADLALITEEELVDLLIADAERGSVERLSEPGDELTELNAQIQRIRRAWTFHRKSEEPGN